MHWKGLALAGQQREFWYQFLRELLGPIHLQEEFAQFSIFLPTRQTLFDCLLSGSSHFSSLGNVLRYLLTGDVVTERDCMKVYKVKRRNAHVVSTCGDDRQLVGGEVCLGHHFCPCFSS